MYQIINILWSYHNKTLKLKFNFLINFFKEIYNWKYFKIQVKNFIINCRLIYNIKYIW